MSEDVDFDFFESPPNNGVGYPVIPPKIDAKRRQESSSVDSQSDTDDSDTQSGSGSETDSSSSVSDKQDSHVKRIEAKIPTARLTVDENERPRNPTPQSGRKRGKAEDEKLEKDSRGEPPKPHNRRASSASGSSSSGSYSSSYNTDSGSESDVTDVSPLNSIRTPKIGEKYNISGKNRRKATASMQEKEVSFKRPWSGRKAESSSSLIDPRTDKIDLRLLMQAVQDMEIEKTRPCRARKQRLQAHSLVPPGPASQPRKNYSFLNEKVRDIDRENQRLMEQILKETNRTKKSRREQTAAQGKRVPTKANMMSSSAINRHRTQQKIEEENLVRSSYTHTHKKKEFSVMHSNMRVLRSYV